MKKICWHKGVGTGQRILSRSESTCHSGVAWLHGELFDAVTVGCRGNIHASRVYHVASALLLVYMSLVLFL